MGFIRKQVRHAEAKKIGRKVEMYSEDKNGRVKITEKVLSAKTDPRYVTRYMLPVGRKRGVCAPGHEDD